MMPTGEDAHSHAVPAAIVAQPPEPHWDVIPQELARRQQWLLWRFEQKPGAKKPAKMPYYVSGGRRTGDQGGDRDRQRLATLDVAHDAYRRGGWSGIGFAFLPGDGLIGIDLDDCLDDTGAPNDRTVAIMAACKSFTERSVSGRGIHIYAQGRTHTNKSNEIGVEMFCERQFFIVTGDAWPGTSMDVRALEDSTISRMHATVDAAKGKVRATRPGRAAVHPAAATAENAAELRSRVEGALMRIPADLSYSDWISIGWALKDAFGEFGFGLWDAWSAQSAKYQGARDLKTHWISFAPGHSPDEAVGVVFARAKEFGWKPPRPRRDARSAPPATVAPTSGNGGKPPTAAVPPPAPPGGGDIPLLRTGNGTPRDCRENVLYCLRHDPELAGLARTNRFTELMERSREAPWGTTAGEWDDQDDLMLGEYLARTYGLVLKNKVTLSDGVRMAAREAEYNPVIDLIKSEPWDGTERLDHWTEDVLGVAPTPYSSLVGRLFVMGMVARVMRPGCKFDYMLILKGPQGAKKSTVFHTLAQPWFTDNAIRMGDKDSLLAMQSVWIAESSELESMNKADANATKQFLSSSEDLFRPPYGQRMLRRPRHAVIGGTTNADTFLRDVTGDRRFWPLEVGEIDIAVLESMRLQLFAEALARLRSKDAAMRRTWPTNEEEKGLIIPAQARFKQTDVWEDILADYVDAPVNHRTDSPDQPAPCKRAFFSTRELFEHALQIRPDRIDGNKMMETRIANCMHALGFQKFRETRGERKRGYMRDLTAASAPAVEVVGDEPEGGDDEPF